MLISRDVGSISNLEGHHTSRALFLKKKGALFKNKRGTSLFIAKSGGHVPPVPPGSYVYANKPYAQYMLISVLCYFYHSSRCNPDYLSSTTNANLGLPPILTNVRPMLYLKF